MKLHDAAVLIVGAGGLGCPIGLYLAAAGVGTLGIADFDLIDETNLQRQIAHHTDDVGTSKVKSLIAQMMAINDLPVYRAHETRIDQDNVRDIVSQYDLVIDGTDNFTTRYLIADTCYFEQKPLVYGAIQQFEGQISVFHASGPCYRCLFPRPPDQSLAPSCSEVGVLGVLPGTIGVMMATEAVKVLVGLGRPLIGLIAIYNALDQSLQKLTLSRDSGCPLCGDHPQIKTICEVPMICEPEKHALSDREISVEEAAKWRNQKVCFLDVREPHEWDICRIEGAQQVSMVELTRSRLKHLSADEPLVVFCHVGINSVAAVGKMVLIGYKNVYSMRGGIDAWSQRIDPTVPRY